MAIERFDDTTHDASPRILPIAGPASASSAANAPAADHRPAVLTNMPTIRPPVNQIAADVRSGHSKQKGLSRHPMIRRLLRQAAIAFTGKAGWAPSETKRSGTDMLRIKATLAMTHFRALELSHFLHIEAMSGRQKSTSRLSSQVSSFPRLRRGRSQPAAQEIPVA